MPFHCASKTIPSEILMSVDDYLRLEGNKNWKICPALRGFELSNLPRCREFDQKICPGVARGDGNAWN